MHSQYLVWDRQWSTQSWLQKRILLRGTGHDRVAWRLLRALRRNPVLMVIAGGLPHNARLFYAVREWAGMLKDATRRRSRHRIRHDVMSLASTPQNNVLSMEYGRILPDLERRLKEYLADLGYAPAAQDAALKTLADDFSAEIPVRLRLWKMLHARLARRDIGILAVPVTHFERTPHVRMGPVFEMTGRTNPETFAREFNMFFRESANRL